MGKFLDNSERDSIRMRTPIPEDSIDRLFDCMHSFYGERWSGQFRHPYSLHHSKVTWRDGLLGLSRDEILTALKRCKRIAIDRREKPPGVVEFFHYAKGIRYPRPVK